MSGQAESLPEAYFDAVYAAHEDPWNFASSDYEAAKYRETLAALGARRYASAFEIGCSIGVFTASLALRCDRLLAVDVSEAALEQARRRCADRPDIDFARMRVPAEFPDRRFDLVVMSEVGYYWSRPDLDLAIGRIERSLEANGVWLLVHWTPEVADYPLTGDEVHEAVIARAGPPGPLRLVRSRREPTYRLDAFEKLATASAGR